MFNLKIVESNRYFDLNIQDDTDNLIPVEITTKNEEELIKSNKILKKTKRIAWAFYKDFRDKAKLYGRAVIHNIGTTELQIRQTIERYSRKIDDKIPFKERVNLFAEIIKKDPYKFAKDLLFLEQRAKDLDAQLIGINLLVGKGYAPDFSQKHNLELLILRCSAPFMPALKENNTQINFRDSDNIEILTDFRLFNCAMYHFFDNAQKYIRPNAHINVTVNFEDKELIFVMKSRVIESHETEAIFQEGFNGIHSGAQKGEGLGLYIFSLVLDKLDAICYVKCNEKTRLGFEDLIYQENSFIIKFPPKTLHKK